MKYVQDKPQIKVGNHKLKWQRCESRDDFLEKKAVQIKLSISFMEKN